MKKHLLFIVATLAISLTIRAQYVNIPDTTFANYLKVRFPTCMNGNKMDTNCAAIVNAISINVGNKSISDLTGVQYFDNLDSLFCRNNNLTSLPPLPASLIYLECYSNQLTSLPALPPTLIALNCPFNQIANIPALPSSLSILYCHYNQLTSLPTLPSSLTALICYTNQITHLPTLPATLTTLNCSYNPLDTILPYPPLLTYLNCSQNNVSALHPLPAGLVYLYCESNSLAVLPTLPATLRELYCDDNNLTGLPALPARLNTLYCGLNLLASLPPLPPSLTILSATGNPLSGGLPALPPSITSISCAGCDLTSLPPLPPVLERFDLDQNYDLKCIPPIAKFSGTSSDLFSIKYTSIACLPNVIEHAGYLASIDTMPVCDLFNQNGCEIAWNIEGSLFDDENADCQWQNTESKVPVLLKVNLYQAGNLVQSVFTTGGKYSFNTDLSTYRVAIDTTGLPVLATCKTDTTLILSANDSLKYGIDFGLHCKPGFDVGAKSIFGDLFRPATTTTIKIEAGDLSNQYGASCAAGINGTVTVSLAGPVYYVSPTAGALTPTSVNNNVISWSVADFAATSFNSSFNIIVRTDTTAQAGQQVCFTVAVTPTSGDNNPGNNSLTQCYNVRASLDPNDKQAYPAGNTDTATKWITYTIRFQNTGNDTAIHIYILDTLSSNLDASTFQLLSSSHKNTTQVYGNGIVKFNFPNIMLPDSNVNEPLSHGYVQYKVKLKDNLPVGTQIENTAYIYFDFNTPVVTNTTTNTITVGSVTAVDEITEEQKQLQLYPNPTTNVVFIVAMGFVPQWINVYDVNGRKVAEQRYAQQIDISSLTKGVYFIEVRNQATSLRSRIVKM